MNAIAKRKIPLTHPWKKFMEHPPVQGNKERYDNSKLPNW